MDILLSSAEIRTARNKALIWLVVAICAASAIFLAFPQVDIWAARQFYLGNNQFWLDVNPAGRWFYEKIRTNAHVNQTGIVLFAGLTLIWLAGLISQYVIARKPKADEAIQSHLQGISGLPCRFAARNDNKNILSTRSYLFIVLSFVLGLGLVTNVALKDGFGRARPNQIVEFGGQNQFSPAWIPSHERDKNGSFVSGDASFVFLFFAFSRLPRKRNVRRAIAGTAITAGCIMGLLRMMKGAHFLSDVMLAGLINILVVLLVEAVILESSFGRKRKPK